MSRAWTFGVMALAAAALAGLPLLGLPAFYDSFLYMIFFWIALATSWAILSGFAGYFSFGHAAFFGAGMYTTATLAGKAGWPFLATVPAAALVAALLGLGLGAVAFRVRRLRGEMFALLTLAVTFVLATVILNTPLIDGGGGVFLSAVPIPALMPTQSGTIYLLGLLMAAATLAIAYGVAHSRFGLGLFAIHDDEDVAEVKGVPTFRFKLVAFALSAALAGAMGGVHAMYVGFLTVGETFGITVPLYVVLMSVLGGFRHWLGPAIGASLIAASLYAFTSGNQAMLGRAAVAAALILAILLLPEGIVPFLRRKFSRSAVLHEGGGWAEADAAPRAAASPGSGVEIRGVSKSFGGIRALNEVSLSVAPGEILGLVGPNGSGKTTLINVISGHFRADQGSISVGGVGIGHLPAHRIARRGVARTYQIPRPFAHLSVHANVALAAAFGAGASTAEADAEARRWLAFTGLGGKAMALPPELNLHERKFLELARALAARPSLLLLDEVLSGLNPAEIDSAIRLIRRIRDGGATIIFVEHLMRAVVELSDRVAVLNEGAVFALGAPREVMRDPRVVGIYLGKAYAA